MRWTRGCFSALARRRRHLFGRSSRVVPTPRRWCQACGRSRRRWWLTSPVHQGERGAAVKTIAQGVPVFRLPCGFLRAQKCTSFCTQGSRVRPASGIPCALFASRVKHDASPGHERAAAIWKYALSKIDRHCEERQRRRVRRSSKSEGGSNPPSARGDMDCFAEPVIGRAFARPVGSQ
jgi:hypothetical protein